MTLWNLLRSEARTSIAQLAAMAAASGFSNSILLAIINVAAGLTTDVNRGKNILYTGFVVSLLIYIISQRYILRVSNTEIEHIVGRLRLRLADKIRNADLQPIEAVGRDRINAVVNRDTQTISQAASPIIVAIQSLVMVFFIGIYIALLNPYAFALTVVIVAIGVAIHTRKRNELMRDLQVSGSRETEFFGTLTHLVEGFKEVKLNSERNQAVYAELVRLANMVIDLKSHTAYVFADHFIFSQTAFYILLGLIVFLLPGAFPGQLMSVTAALLFVIGPLSSLIGTLPVFSMANVAVANVAALEAQLDLLQPERPDTVSKPPADYNQIELSTMYFAYRDRQGAPTFEVGPLELTIRKQEVLFIVGGNGSGKSTFLKLLTGLYYPESGSLRVDNKDVTAIGYTAYRNMFSAIFSDYHLFDRVFGVRYDDNVVNAMVKDMELTGKTSFRDGRFENQDLSTGQRKRLALIISLLEDRPIYVFDEWAADQDPHFRERFYTEILPDLKRRQKTIIAATHDDKYFGAADRVLRMDNGKFVQP